MTATPLQELLALPDPERVELATALCQSLDSGEQDQPPHIESALSAELEQRWAKHQQHPEEAVSWDVVRQDLG